VFHNSLLLSHLPSSYIWLSSYIWKSRRIRGLGVPKRCEFASYVYSSKISLPIPVDSFIEGSGGENPDGIYVDGSGRIVIAGETSSTDFLVTANAFQSTNAGSNDGLILVLSPYLSSIEYSTYFGGALYDNGRTMLLGSDGALYLAGGTLSTNHPVLNAADLTFNGGSHRNAPGSGDAWAAKFMPVLSPALAGDYNADGSVDTADYIV
jgi:hypothetical protein